MLLLLRRGGVRGDTVMAWWWENKCILWWHGSGKTCTSLLERSLVETSHWDITVKQIWTWCDAGSENTHVSVLEKTKDLFTYIKRSPARSAGIMFCIFSPLWQGHCCDLCLLCESQVRKRRYFCLSIRSSIVLFSLYVRNARRLRLLYTVVCSSVFYIWTSGIGVCRRPALYSFFGYLYYDYDFSPWACIGA